MAVFSHTYVGRYGLNTITDAQLAYVTILGVKRVGVGYRHVASDPSSMNREFTYDSSMGQITFSEDHVFGLDQNENVVFVMWKT